VRKSDVWLLKESKPMSKSIIFPGQGSQSVGMGKEMYDTFPIAKHVFQEVDDALGQNLSRLIFEGPEADLMLTENTQPALMAVSLAIMKVLETQGKVQASAFQCAAGHSLGEYSALAAIGVVGISETARLLKTRGKAMQQAVPVGVGAMIAVIGADLEIAEDIAKEAAQGQMCAIANDNAPGQVVLSGHKEAIDRAIEIAKEKGIRKCILLPVSAPFHCPLMAPAARAMEQALSHVEFILPRIPLISNITASYETDPHTLKSLLVEQVTGRVRWRETILKMQEDGVQCAVEIGAGKVLTNLVKRICPEMVTVTLNTPQDIESFLQTL
jgi:[acyl-carrier-protein] S-malonyltransferase